MDCDRLFGAQDIPHTSYLGDIGHLDVDNLGTQLAQRVNGSLYCRGLFRVDTIGRESTVKSNP